MKVLSIFLAIIPGILICLYIYKSDKYEKEVLVPLIFCFILGMLITVPVRAIQAWTYSVGLDDSSTILMALFSSFIIVSLSEELFKFASLLIFPYRQKFFNEPLDGIVYAVMIGMGFATLENILYATQYGVVTTIVRAFTAVPAHAVFAIIMGYYVGKAKFEPQHRLRLLLVGLCMSIAIHGTYDFFILQEAYEWLIILAIFTLAISIYFARNLIQTHQDNSPFKKEIP